MPQSRGKYQFWKESSLSQKLAHRHPEYQEYAGTDRKISDSIATLNILGQFGILDLEEPSIKFVKALLNEQRKSAFATSEKVNEITKMGLQMPKAEDVYFGDSD